MILEAFDKIYLINLKKRPDRLKKWFTDNDFVIKNVSTLQIIEAIDGSKINHIPTNWLFGEGALGCLESHLYVLKDARKNNYQSILVLEDDFIFDDNFNRKFPLGLKELPLNWDMLYLYSSHFKTPDAYGEFLEKANAVIGTVAYAVNAKIYEPLINVMELRARQVDVVYAHMHFLINAYSFRENICHHYDGYSDIQNSLTNYHENTKPTIPSKILTGIKSILKKLK